ncbi:MAG TPA: hypothetical protein VHZ26_05790 [Caulobacteraceae bacterium]|jgi:hypothetical protein|nr:hypothetical protein [Caulobacteraceae bacterium]
MEEERFIGGWTRSKLAARTAQERYAIWKRARTLKTADGNQLAREIELLGLPYAEPGVLADDDPLREAMQNIMATKEARSACIEATLDGLPAVAGADALFHEALGVTYRHNDVAIATAHAMTAQLMEGLGYVEAGQKDLPNRYVARSGVFWKKK